MADLKFSRFRNDVVRSFSKYNVPYKLFGGAVVQLIEPERATEDLDFFVRRNLNCVKLVILALVDCGFNTQDSLIQQIFGFDITPFVSEKQLYATCRLVSNKEVWKNYHIDLAFDIGVWDYDSTPTEMIDHNGVLIRTVSYLGVARMKANIYPAPREKDILDIGVIANYLGLDPSTGRPVTNEKKGRRRRWK